MGATDQQLTLSADLKADFLARCEASAADGTFRRLTLGKHRGTEPPERVVIIPVTIKGTPMLSFKLTNGTQEETKNFELAAAWLEVSGYLGVTLKSATLCTTEKDTTIQFSRKGVPGIATSKPSFQGPASPSINREKNYLVPASSPFLHLLGITNAAGVVRSDKFDKFRQVNKFVEIIDALVRASGLAAQESIRIVDFGSGKNYLTFALHAYLSETLGLNVTTVGIEARGDLVDHGNESARRAAFDGLSFREGHIASVDVTGTDMVVALHACDTATDDALAKAVLCGARIIAMAPCCQKYVRPRMRLPADLEPILKHGIMEERFAESLTNGLRALVLESYGYQAKVFEFIAGEHTAKNIMITGTSSRRSRELESSPAALSERVSEIARLKGVYGLDDFYLDRVLGL